jgi:hypothetical protein
MFFAKHPVVESCLHAKRHHEQLRDDLLIEGADHHFEIRPKHIYEAGRNVGQGYSVMSLRSTPFVQPKPICVAYSPPVPPLGVKRSYFSTNLRLLL